METNLGECMLTVSGSCGTGNLGFRTCDDDSTVVVMCDECDAVWRDVEHTEARAAVYPFEPSFTVPGTTLSIARPKSRRSSREEVVAFGWANWIAGETSPLG